MLSKRINQKIVIAHKIQYAREQKQGVVYTNDKENAKHRNKK